MMSRHTNWRGTLIRLMALATLALALAAPLAVGMAPRASAAPASCGSHDCGPGLCEAITPADFNTPQTSRRGGASASLSRAHGVTGTALTLTGSGWPAGAPVDLELGVRSDHNLWVNPSPFAQTVADASGRLGLSLFRAPPVPPCDSANGPSDKGGTALFVVQTPDGKARVSLLFTYGPTPLINSDATEGGVNPGDAVTLGGVHWEPGQTVTITPAVELWPRSGWPSFDPSAFQPLPDDALVVKAEANGAFTGRIHIPQAPPEALVMFIATAKGPRNGDVWVQVGNVYAIGPSATPTLTVSHTSAFAGEQVTVSGANWPANQDIQIEYCRGQSPVGCQPEVSQALALVTADASGRLAVTVQIPSDARPGSVTIQARVLTSPFGMMYYDQARPFAILYPFAQAHPRIELALRALPYVITALMIALIALVEWLGARRRGPAQAARL